MKTTAVTLLLLAALVAGPPGEWTRVTAPTGRNVDEPAVARTADGLLHLVALKRGTDPGVVGLVHYAIDAAGRPVGEPTSVLEDWRSLSNPALLVDGDSLRVLVSGIRGSAGGDPFAGGIYTLTAPLDGSSWALQDASVTRSRNTGAPGATKGADGTIVVTWATSSGLFFHAGVAGAGDDVPIVTGACCTYEPAAATDAGTGEVVVGWYANIRGAHGLSTATLAAGAAAPQFAPGSASPDRTNSLTLSQRFALGARAGAPGVYAAYCAGYPTCEEIRLWRHGASDALTVARPQRARVVNRGALCRGRLDSPPARPYQ